MAKTIIKITIVNDLTVDNEDGTYGKRTDKTNLRIQWRLIFAIVILCSRQRL